MTYYVYILTNRFDRVLYIGVTNDLNKRLNEHLQATQGSFTAKYKVNKLVYYETYSNIEDAIAREKQLKGWRREKKLHLITSVNPNFEPLIPYADGNRQW